MLLSQDRPRATSEPSQGQSGTVTTKLRAGNCGGHLLPRDEANLQQRSRAPLTSVLDANGMTSQVHVRAPDRNERLEC